jgi:hypothetical protein
VKAISAKKLDGLPVRPGDTWQFEDRHIGRVTVVDVKPRSFLGTRVLEVSCVRHGDPSGRVVLLGQGAFSSAHLLDRVHAGRPRAALPS